MKFVPKNITKPESDQDVFNRAWDHAIVRRAPHCAKGHGETKLCRYRKQGNCCLIGACMPQNMATFADSQGTLGCGGIHSLLIHSTSIGQWFEKCNPVFLGDLQAAHDCSMDAVEYGVMVEKRLRRVAEEFKLQVPA